MRPVHWSRWLWSAGLIAGLVLGSACSKESAPSGEQQKKATAVAATDDAQAGKKALSGEKEAGAEKSGGPQVWTYDPTDKRNIFEVPQAPTPPCMENVLTCYDLNQLWIDAIIYGSGMDIAHVILPGGRDAVVKVGDEIGLNHGRVKQIREGEIVVEEIYVDPARPSDIHIIEKLLKMELSKGKGRR